MSRPAQAREHGTRRGYDQHRRGGEEACEACQAAVRDRSAQRRASGQDSRGALRNKARGRALQRLAQRYPMDFMVLLEQETVRLEDESDG